MSCRLFFAKALYRPLSYLASGNPNQAARKIEFLRREREEIRCRSCSTSRSHNNAADKTKHKIYIRKPDLNPDHNPPPSQLTRCTWGPKRVNGLVVFIARRYMGARLWCVGQRLVDTNGWGTTVIREQRELDVDG